jgi:hypothetical protein
MQPYKIGTRFEAGVVLAGGQVSANAFVSTSLVVYQLRSGPVFESSWMQEGNRRKKSDR